MPAETAIFKSDTRLAALLGRLSEACDVEQAVRLVQDHFAARWPLRLQVLTLPGSTPSQAPRAFPRGASVPNPFQLCEPMIAWATLFLRDPSLRRSEMAWLPIVGPGDCLPGFLLLLRNGGEFDSDEADELQAICAFVSPLLCQLRRTQGLRRLLDQQARERQERETELTALNRVLTLVNEGPLEAVFPQIATEMRRLLPFAWAGLVAWTDAPEDLREVAGAEAGGAPRRLFSGMHLNGSALAAVRLEEKAACWGDIGDSPEAEDLARLRAAGYRSALVEPLRVHGKSWGALLLAAREPHQFRPHDCRRLLSVSVHLAAALANAADLRQIEASRGAWERTFNAVPEGLVVLGPQDRVLLLNRAASALFAKAGMEALGRPLAQVLDLAETSLRDGARVRHAGRDYLVSRFTELAGPMLSEEPVTVVVFRELPAAPLSDEDLIQGEKLTLLGQLMAGIAHELNNPLTAVIGFSALLQTQQAEGRLKQQLEAIETSAVRCQEIVRGLLSFARKHAAERKPVQLPNLVRQTIALLRYQLQVSNVTVESAFPSSFPTLSGDEYQLQQVLVNLIVNAFQAITDAKKGSRIWIRGEDLGVQVRLSVEDDGPGLSPVVQARLFQAFVTTKPEGKGTGLGLSITRQIIVAHGGNIEVEERPGGGTIFSMRLPVSVAPVVACEGAGPAAAARLPFARVMVVEDEKAVRDLLRRILEDAGAQPLVFDSARDAILALQEDEFDAVLCDLRMPDIGGRELYAWLRDHQPGLASRVVILTGDTVNETTASFLRETGVRCMMKPFRIATLLDVLAEVLAPVGARETGAAGGRTA